MDIYIDLGTSNTLIYGKGRGLLLNEPSILALKSRNVFGFGKNAKLMLGKTPLNITVERPLKEGVIANFETTAKMLWSFVARIKSQNYLFRPRMIISLPCQVTSFEKNAVKDVGLSMGARTVHLLDEPMSAAIGAGLSVLKNRGQMVIDIGGGTTEIAVIALGGIISSRAVRVGGNTIDDAIIAQLQSQQRFLVGEQTAEKIKIAVAQAVVKQNLAVDVGGFDLSSCLPKRMSVTSNMIAPAVDGVLRQIIMATQNLMSEVSPEISGDIIANGITLTGGGALLRHLPGLLATELKVPIHVAVNPLMSVGVGGAMALENNKLFEALERPA